MPLVLQLTTCENSLGPNAISETTRVLLIEDNATDANLVCSALSDLRDRELFGPVFHIRSAQRLSEAITCLADDVFDVILLDLSLPDSQSLEHTFTHIQNHAPQIPIIVLTGSGDEILGLKMVRAGAQDFLVKSKMERYVLVKAIRYAIERQRSEELAKSARTELQLKLVAVQEEERHRIARELHDQMGQSIAALMLGLKSVKDSNQHNGNTCSQIQQLHHIASDLAAEVHSLALDLRPTALDDLGLEIALSTYLEGWSRRSGITADFHCNGFSKRRLPAHLETTLYRIAQAALANVVRHAHAQTVSLVLESTDNRVLAIIEDDGCGFDVESVMTNPVKEQRLGLLGMEERVALVGGTLTVESTQGAGTSVYVRIPITFQANGERAQWTS